LANLDHVTFNHRRFGIMSDTEKKSEEPRRTERSRSPQRTSRGSRGFRWKDSRPRDRDDDRRDHDKRRDFRNRSPPRHRNLDRERDRGRDQDRDRRRDRERERDHDGDIRSSKKVRDDDRPKKEKKAPAPRPGGGEEMIIVNINDRLGTKSAIPCLPSDTIGQLKLMVAARIGREPGQIMLKRQGERPFKDPISLEDYGISNGVQIDLEVDTGD
jgi:hypothetical protein